MAGVNRQEPADGRAWLPVEQDGGLVADDLREVTRLDEQMVAGGRLDRGAIGHDVADAARDDVLAMVERAVLERHPGLDVTLPAPPGSERREPHSRLAAEAEAGHPDRHLGGPALLSVVGPRVGLAE